MYMPPRSLNPRYAPAFRCTHPPIHILPFQLTKKPISKEKVTPQVGSFMPDISRGNINTLPYTCQLCCTNYPVCCVSYVHHLTHLCVLTITGASMREPHLVKLLYERYACLYVACIVAGLTYCAGCSKSEFTMSLSFILQPNPQFLC